MNREIKTGRKFSKYDSSFDGREDDFSLCNLITQTVLSSNKKNIFFDQNILHIGGLVEDGVRTDRKKNG